MPKQMKGENVSGSESNESCETRVYTGSEDCYDASEMEGDINLQSITHCITLHPV